MIVRATIEIEAEGGAAPLIRLEGDETIRWVHDLDLARRMLGRRIAYFHGILDAEREFILMEEAPPEEWWGTYE